MLAWLRQLAEARQGLRRLTGISEPDATAGGLDELTRALDALADAFLTLDEAWRFSYINAEAARILGRPASELLGQVAWEAFPEAKGSIFEQQYEKARSEQCSVTFEAYFAPMEKWFHIRAHPAAGGVAVYFQDITGRKRLESFKERQGELLERIATGAPLSEVMDGAVQMVEEQYPHALCSILLMSEDGMRMRHGSAPNLPSAYNQALDGLAIGPAAGSCGTAAYEKRTVVVSDIAQDPLWADYRELALGHGLRACWSFPIFSASKQVLGTFGVYYPTLRAPEAGELDLVQSLSRLVGIAIERDRSHHQLKLLEASVSKLNDIVLITEAEPISDPGPRILFVNEAFERRTGYTREEVLGKTPRLLQGPKTQRAELDRIRTALQKWEPVRGELINYTKSGEEFWLELNIAPVADATGWFTHWVSVERDITERKRAELLIRESEARFKLVAKATTDAIWDWDLATDALWWNEGMTTLFGYSLEELEPGLESWTNRLHPEDLDRVVHGIHAVIDAGEQNWSDEYRFRRKDGSYAFVLDRGFIIRSDDSSPVRMVGGMTDLTERRIAEEEIRQAADTQARIVEIQRAISATHLEPQAAMDLIAERAKDLLGSVGGVVELVEGPDMLYRAVSGVLSAHTGLRLKREGSLSGLCVKLNQVLVCTDSETDDRVDRKACRIVGARSMLVAPLTAEGKVFGALKVLSDKVNAFTKRDEHTLQILAESLGSVLQRARMEEQLRDSEAQYRLMFEGNPHPMWVYDVATLRFLAVNAAAVKQYGYSEAEFLGMTLLEIRPEADRPKIQALIASPNRGRRDHERWCHQKKDGSLLYAEITSDDIVFNGTKARLVLAHDVTERLRAEQESARLIRAQRMLSSCNEALIRAVDEPTLLAEVCRIAVDIGGYRMAWVGYAEEDEARSITPVAHAGVEDGYLKGIPLSWSEDHPSGRGPGGTAIRTGAVVAISDLTKDPAFGLWLTRAQARGYRGVVSLPLKHGDQTLGMFSLFLGEVVDITADEIVLLQELANDLAFGLLTLRSQAEKAMLQEAVLKIGMGVSETSGESFFEGLVRNMVEALEADAGFVVRLLPGEPRMARVIAGFVDGAPAVPFDYPVEGTPCEQLFDVEDCVVPAKAAEHYPQSPSLVALGAQAYVGRRLHNAAGEAVGLLYVLYRKPLKQPAFIASTLRIFAGRAAMELGRLESDARIREQASLLDEAQEAIIVRGMDHRIQFWNRGAERLYGWPAAEVIGRYVEELLYEDPTFFRQASDKLLEFGEWNGEIAQRRQDGKVVMVEGHWTLVRDEQGQPKSVLAINADITRRMALEEQLKQSQRLEAIGQLTGGVAHDFNNLLTVILGNSDLLAEQLKEQPRLFRLADMTRTAAQRGADLTQRLLAFGRRQALQPKAVNVNQLLANMDGMLRRTLGEDIEIEYIRGAGLWPAMVDPSQLDGAVLNLCINARDAMKEGGRLTLETGNTSIDQAYADLHADVAPGQYVMVAVSDTGSGIPPEILAKVFDPFFTTKEVGKGTGLGLSMVYGFVKQSRGHIKLYSEPGHGTTVRMYIPRADRAADELVEPSMALDDFRGTETILLVEDNELVRHNAEEQLLNLGYRVLVAGNGPEAIEVLRKEADIDLLFTDVVMPGGMTGRELALAAQELRPGLKVLYTSGYTENSIVHHGRLDKGVHLLNKPYRQIDLARKVRAVLKGD